MVRTGRALMPKTTERSSIVGTFVLRTWNQDGSLAEERISKNVMCAVGLTVLAQAINWSGVVDQNANMGNAFSYQDLTPIYGAIGTGNTTPTDADVLLTAEVDFPNGRSPVYAGATSAAISGGTDATWTWDFFFGIPPMTIVIAECGVFVNSTNSIDVPGQLLDHALISPTVTQTTAQTATLSVTFSIGNT